MLPLPDQAGLRGPRGRGVPCPPRGTEFIPLAQQKWSEVRDNFPFTVFAIPAEKAKMEGIVSFPKPAKAQRAMTAEGTCSCGLAATEDDLLAQLDDVLKSYVSVPGALIPVLQIAQGMFGYLPETALKKISLALNKSYSEVAGVVGFYSFFTTVPRGKHLVRACLGTACYVRGGKQVLQAMQAAWGSRSARPPPTASSRWTWAAASAPADWPR